MKEEKKRVLANIKGLSKSFPVKGQRHREVKAVDTVYLQIYEGETLAVVGESGCGKSTFGRTILKLVEPTGGEVIYDGVNFNTLTQRQMREFRKKIQMVFQDPYASLNPRKTVRQMLEEPIAFHRIRTGKEEIEKQILRVMDMCGLPSYVIDRYPHEFSGGQRQRICIARSLAVEPDFLVLDEPVSALDVSIQSQIINLLQDLQRELDLTYLFISHDLSVVNHIADRVAVMYLGSIVELAPKESLYEHPRHPYTRALLSAIPRENPRESKERIILTGEIPSAVEPPAGCKFHTRCPYAAEKCTVGKPEFREVAPGHFVACSRLEEIG